MNNIPKWHLEVSKKRNEAIFTCHKTENFPNIFSISPEENMRVKHENQEEKVTTL